MAKNEKRRADRYTNGAEVRAHGALAKYVKIALAFDALLTAGVFALAVAWGLALPAAGSALAFIVSAFMLKGGAA